MVNTEFLRWAINIKLIGKIKIKSTGNLQTIMIL